MYLTYSGGIHSFIMVNKALDFVITFNLSLCCSNWVAVKVTCMYLVNNISLDVKLLPLFMFTG